jgi:hypothetical protein
MVGRALQEVRKRARAHAETNVCRNLVEETPVEARWVKLASFFFHLFHVYG